MANEMALEQNKWCLQEIHTRRLVPIYEIKLIDSHQYIVMQMGIYPMSG